MSPTCHTNNASLIYWHEFLECSQILVHAVAKFQIHGYNTFRDMNYYPVTDRRTDGRTDRQTDRKRCIWAHRAICTGGLKNILAYQKRSSVPKSKSKAKNPRQSILGHLNMITLIYNLKGMHVQTIKRGEHTSQISLTTRCLTWLCPTCPKNVWSAQELNTFICSSHKTPLYTLHRDHHLRFQ